MANFLITTPGQVTRGTTEADTIVFGGAGVSAATVIGNTGADTISINSTATFQSTDFMMNGGHDMLDINFSAGAHTVNSSNFFGGGKGNDSISLVSAGKDVNVFVAKGGSGRDTITLDGIDGSQISIGGNAGHDLISYDGTATKSYVGGGKGNDTITLSGNFEGGIYGGLLDDQIEVATVSGTVLNGDSGNDKITVSAVVGTGSFINGNAGNDTITVTSLAADNTVGGGNNADLITVTNAVGTAMVAGGKGHDDINVSAGVSGTTVYGGLGADTIDIAGDTVLKVNAGDSTLGTLDVVSGGFTTVNTVTAVRASGAVITNSAGTKTFEIADGVLKAASFLSGGATLTSVVASVDKLSELSKGGNTVAFNMSGDSYLFIQGGTIDSTTDDIVVKFSTAVANTLTVTDKTKVSFT